MAVLNKKFLNDVTGVFFVILLFIFASIFANRYQTQMEVLVGNDDILGMAAYVALTIFAVVFAPVSTLPLIPIASKIWGWVVVGTLSVIGWTIGAQVAFLLARHFGKPLVKKIVSLEKLHRIEDRIPKRHLFWTVVFLRISVPVDVLSYTLGLFSRMKSVPYFFATLVGVAPFAFVFAYAGALPFLYQMEAFGLALFIMLLAYLKKRHV